jgi:hypothetical protein
VGGLSPVKDFVRDAWKIAAACAVGAFVLSLVVGLIAGNPFGIAFGRAFLLALLFAGIGGGLRAVIKTYLPEMLGSAPAQSAPEAARGGSVDIVLPEDETLQRQAFQHPPGAGRRGAGAAGAEGARAEDGEQEDAASQAAEEEPTEVLEAPDSDEDSQAEARALGELAAEMGEEIPPAEEAGQADRGPPRGQPSPAAASEGDAEEVQPEDGLPRGVNPQAGELDSLPDIAQLEPLPGQRSGPAPRVPRSAVGQTPEDAVRNLLSNEDPVTLARAVRTALKKDEKG